MHQLLCVAVDVHVYCVVPVRCHEYVIVACCAMCIRAIVVIDIIVGCVEVVVRITVVVVIIRVTECCILTVNVGVI